MKKIDINSGISIPAKLQLQKEKTEKLNQDRILELMYISFPIKRANECSTQ